MKMRGFQLLSLFLLVCIVADLENVEGNSPLLNLPDIFTRVRINPRITVSPSGGGSAVDSVGTQGGRPDTKVVENPQHVHP
ncbi:hypothetical protein SUGI_0025890 [Cryptomeria japonica]|nr:hypothetical protein SUGI_0025890 [Cryptomeria japonica]